MAVNAVLYPYRLTAEKQTQYNGQGRKEKTIQKKVVME